MCEINKAKLQDMIQSNNKDLTTMKHNLQMAEMKIKVSQPADHLLLCFVLVIFVLHVDDDDDGL